MSATWFSYAPVDKYDTLVYTALSVTYKKDGQTITVTDKTESRSVKAVAEAIVNAPNATEAEKEYARGLLNAFNKNGWSVTIKRGERWKQQKRCREEFLHLFCSSWFLSAAQVDVWSMRERIKG